MFFYGTLKRGHSNHDAFCQGARFLGEATVRGNLYALPYGYPALIVPAEDILALGTANPTGDATTRWRLDQEPGHQADGLRAFGELFAFDDPEGQLPAIDRLEGFDPDEGKGPYRRVLLPVETRRAERVLAWVYVVEQSSGTLLPEGRWPN